MDGARFALKDFDVTRIDVVVTSRKSAEELIPTRASLLVRIKDPADDTSWREFHETYRRLIFGVARKAGLSEVEAEDATQDTLVAVAQNIAEFRYEPKRCSFKTWLMMITRQRIIWQIRKRQGVGGSELFGADGAGRFATGGLTARDDDTERTATVERVPDPANLNLDAIWDEEWQQNLLAAALERVKEQVNSRQFQIFELAAIQAWSVSDIARTLRVNAAQVYLARHRVGAALKREVRKLESEF
ncbi:MAG: sigma-70 family RNA polymerase sigma factor [Verrucomicrobia bacterium]|nr:sigma-70 family RNA polymerase sigma factor [Verrucomicrobiota bacterium]